MSQLLGGIGISDPGGAPANPAMITGSLTTPRIPYASGAQALTDTADLFWNAAKESLTIVTAGAVLDPPLISTEKPQIHSGGEFDGVAAGHASWYLDSFANVSSLSFRRANGTQSSKTAIGVADVLNLRAIGYDGSDYAVGGFFRFRGTSTWSGSNHGMDFLVFLTADGSAAAPVEVLRMKAEGLQLGANIGTVATTGILRIPNDQYLYSRGGTAINVKMIGVTPSNAVAIGDSLRVNQIGEVWETEPNNGDFRPGTSNNRDFGGSTRIVRTGYIARLVNPPQTTPNTGNQAAFASTSSWLRCNNATTITFQGIAAMADGYLLHITAVGAGTVDITHQNGSATAVDRIITPTAGTLTVTQAILRYDGTTQRWRVMFYV